MVVEPPMVPEPARVPPEWTVTELVLERLAPVARARVPLLTVVVPESVLLAVTVVVPVPVFTRLLVPVTSVPRVNEPKVEVQGDG